MDADDGTRKRSSRGKNDPFLEAIFLDVPFILDSIFRWSEFRLNRLGRFDLSLPDKPWMRAEGWRSPAFGLYALISVFMVFGPTFDSLCGVFGATGIRSASHALGWVAIALIIALYVWQLARVLQRLTRRLRDNEENYNSGSSGLLVWTADRIRALLQSVVGSGVLLSPSALQMLLALIPDLRRSTGRLNARGRVRFFTATIFLLGIMLCLSAPWWLVVRALRQTDPSAAVCLQGNHGAVLWQFAVLGVFVLGGAWLWTTRRIRREVWRLAALAGLWFAGLAALWGLAAVPHANEMKSGPYPHVYPVVIAALVGFALFAHWFAHQLFGNPRRLWIRVYLTSKQKTKTISWRALFRRRMRTVELIENDRGDPYLNKTRILGAFVNGIGAQPLLFLLIPGFVALVSTPHHLFTWTFVATLLSAGLLTYGSLAERWQQLVTYINRWYLVGAPLPLSILVIVLGILRLLNVQYVSTVLDASSVGTLVVIVTMCYVGAWFYEYWINRWPAQYLLGALGTHAERRQPERCQGTISYSYAGPVQTDGPQRSPRRLSVHGTGRYCAQGWLVRQPVALWDRPLNAAFTTYDLVGLFEKLAPPNDPIARRAVNSLTRRMRLYFYTLNALLVVVFGLLWYWHLQLAGHERSQPVVTASLDAPSSAPSLSERLQVQQRGGRPAIIVAASGGGTRAALYTVHALEGLARLDKTRDVVLISGVSGGGFASAVFAKEWGNLHTSTDQAREAWEAIIRTATEPFIADVLDGVGETRVFNSTPMGQLLAESFRARTFEGIDPVFGSLSGPALILNTSISGHPAGESELLAGRAALSGTDPGCSTQTSLAGSRLIFTNLPMEKLAGEDGASARTLDPFPGNLSDFPDVRLGYTVVRDPSVSLASAAALNANFPPVFPNARVVLTGGASYCSTKSFYVTDGGATENLGLVSALYALRGALIAWPTGESLPPVHMVAVEASAVSYDYSQDRGLGAATGGSKERINGALTQILLDDIKSRMKVLGGELHLHYLPLPVAFRSRGGFGTHWMYAQEFRVTNPFIVKVPNRFMAPLRQKSWFDNYPIYESIDQKDLAVLWSGLFRADAGFCSDQRMQHDLETMTNRARQVRAWICGQITPKDDELRSELGKSISRSSVLGKLLQQPRKADYQVEAWECLVAQLGSAAPLTSASRTCK